MVEGGKSESWRTQRKADELRYRAEKRGETNQIPTQIDLIVRGVPADIGTVHRVIEEGLTQGVREFSVFVSSHPESKARIDQVRKNANVKSGKLLIDNAK